MAIQGFDRNRFVETLRAHITASKPVQSIEHLYGREKELQRIEQALEADGRHIFIFGDRGVGKSSLAASAAAQYQSSDADPISIPCGPDTTFYGTVEDLARKVIGGFNATRKLDVAQSLTVLGVYTVSVNNVKRDIEVPKVDSMFAAVEAIKAVAVLHSKMPVVVIDEFDQIGSEKERSLFASFLKNLGDSGVNVKFIFTGVAASLDELLRSHESSFRQLHTERLDRLAWSGREEIVMNAASAFDLSIGDELAYLIAKISNGFPYYVHLITEHLLWQAFNSDVTITELDDSLFRPALTEAIAGISAQLQRPYTAATAHRSADYRDVVWATADSESDFRSVEAMWKSYLRIHQAIYGESPSAENRPFDKSAFTARISALKKKSFGEILQPYMDRRGIYAYRENILRGFVAMKALEANVELQGDVPDEPKMPTAKAKVTKGQAALADWTPRGIKFRGEKDDD